MKPNALYFSSLNFHSDCRTLLECHFELITLPSPAQLDEDCLATAELLFAPLGWHWGESVFEKMPRLKVVASNTTGHPHIDVIAAGKREVSVITLKGQDEFLNTITPTAEHTLGLMIALTRNYRSAMKSVEEGHWNRFPHAAEKMLSRSSVGIVGLGRLGKMVASYCNTLGMHVVGYDPYIASDIPNIERAQSLEELVANVDIVTVHVPHEPSTENMFDSRLFQRFRSGGFFINTSRGELVDTPALLEALTCGKLQGAALDVLDCEFSPDFSLKRTQLWSHVDSNLNLILTPHIGGSTRDAWRETQRFVIEKSIKVFDQNL